MADFVQVLKKTIEGLGENTPETRQKVYGKARSTIAAKLAAINPPPPPALAERQMKSLEEAIVAVEGEYRTAEPPLLDPIEELESAIASLSVVQPQASAPARPAYEPAPAAAAPSYQPAFVGDTRDTEHDHHPSGEPAYGDDDYADAGEEVPRRRRNLTAPLAAAAALLVLAGAGYAAWVNQDQLAGLFGASESETVAAETVQPDEPEPEIAAEPAAGAEQVATADPQAGDEPDPAETPGEAEPSAADARSPAEAAVEKFTQRLTEDGAEVDEGPAGGAPTVGEGTSIAAATGTAEPTQPAPLEALQPDAGEPAPEQQAVAENDAVAVGQKAIFYEERTNAAQGSAEDGTIVWSLVQESPGGDLPPEPAIRAEAMIPGKDIQLRMTIRRNGDQTLPASHIVELIFLTPENFEGGGIDNVLRVALKDTEQAAGNALLGIPAKISDGFFLFALSDGAAEMEANTALLSRQSWIDIPIVYRSGRRALMTMEKGIPGDKVFDEAMKAWRTASSG
jgi:hypothetical protein